VVSRAGISFLHRNAELIRCGTDLRATARARVPGEIHGVCLSPDERYVAVGFVDDSFGSEYVSLVRIFNAATLKPAVTLTLEAPDATYPRAVGARSGGWWLLAGGEGGDSFIQFGRNGKAVKTHEAWGEGVTSPDGRTVYIADEAHVAAIDTGSGKERRFPFSWRKDLPAEFLPSPSNSDIGTRLRVSSLTVSPDGKMLILTEWLSGDPEA
jgi:WD40 repeat protein